MNSEWVRLHRAALVALAAHLIAGVAMVLLLRQGLETTPDLAARIGYIGHSSGRWIAGWLPWNMAALSFLYLGYRISRAHGRHDGHGLLSFGVLLIAGAVAADLAAEVIEMGVLPDLARGALTPGGATNISLFLAFHRLAVLLTGYVANTLYAVTLLFFALGTRRGHARWIWLAGLGAGVAALGLSATSLANSARGMLWTNAMLVPLLLIWMIGVARTADRHAAREVQHGSMD